MKHCLIVDDCKVIRKVARTIFESMNFSATEACNGKEALAQCRQSRPDVILLDWNMPVMDGMEFLHLFNTMDHGRAGRPRIVFCTTENSISHIREAIEAGADDYVMKPFDRETLEGKLQLIGLA